MKILATILVEFFRSHFARVEARHDDALRANQSSPPAPFSPWRALVRM